MRKTFCSRGSNSIHNGVFNTESPLSIGTIVKLNNRDPSSVKRFSSDPIVTSIKQYNNTTMIDLITTMTDLYILGSTNNTYFILKRSLETSSDCEIDQSSIINLGIFQEPLSLNGHISIRNGNIVVLIYHIGQFIVTGNRHSFATNNGVLFNISIQDNKILGFRNIPLTSNFILFGGLEENNREEFLYLLDDTKLHRFNPSGSSSWIISIDSGKIISATTAPGLLLLLYNNRLQAIDINNGKLLWTHSIDSIAKCCMAYGSHIYISTINNNNITIIQANVTNDGMNVISRNSFIVPKTPIICCVSTLNSDKYIIWTDNEIRIYTNDNNLLSITTLRNISLTRTYRLLPRHISYLKIPIIVNGVNSLFINDIETFTGIEYAGFFILQDEFPQRAGVVTDIINDNKVYVVLTGPVSDIFQNLTLHRTYIIDINGNLTGLYHDVNQGKPFLIAGNEPNVASYI
jgi:hypothetical protein